jgi:hypothetical protein
MSSRGLLRWRTCIAFAEGIARVLLHVVVQLESVATYCSCACWPVLPVRKYSACIGCFWALLHCKRSALRVAAACACFSNVCCLVCIGVVRGSGMAFQQLGLCCALCFTEQSKLQCTGLCVAVCCQRRGVCVITGALVLQLVVAYSVAWTLKELNHAALYT